MMRKKRTIANTVRWLVSMATLLLFVFSVTTPALAWKQLYKNGYYLSQYTKSYVSYKWGNNLTVSGSTIRNGFESAVSDWYTASSVNFSFSSSSVNVLNSINDANAGYYGIAHLEHSAGEIQKFTAMVNVATLPLTSLADFARCVAGHELGHTLGLADVTTGAAIMNISVTPGTYIVPQKDDKDGIKHIYG